MPVFRIGADDFKKLRDNNGYFVDKSLLMKEIIEGNDVTLLPRPRRFGKTLNMTMLRYFFELSDDNRKYLFEDLAIADHPGCMKHQGQYPVHLPQKRPVQPRSDPEDEKAEQLCG